MRLIPRSVCRAAALLAGFAACGGSVAARDAGDAAGQSVDDATLGPDGNGEGTPGVDAPRSSPDGPTSSCPTGHASAIAPGRVPVNHRSSAGACSTPRDPITPTACGCPDGGSDEDAGADGASCPCGSCAQDSDCDAGTNGRCEVNPYGSLFCAYDECTSDSDCKGRLPCTCRWNSTAANFCESGSNCGVDSDCGPGGYCSPSLVDRRCVCLSTALCGDSGECSAGGAPVACACGDSCGHGYFCHTPCDTCIDDSDCGGAAGSCAYDSVDGRWECAYCLPVP